MDVMQDKNTTIADSNLVEVPVLQKDGWGMQPLKLAIPDTDYDQNGNLKKVRWRMLKKLFKYEWKGLIPVLLLVGTVLISAILGALSLRFLTAEASNFSVICIVLCVLVFLFSTMGALFASWTVPAQRYDNNFFKAEGYLTFSIPASMEEHLLAKRITAVASIVIAQVGTLLGIILLGGIIDPVATFKSLGDIFVSIYEDYGGAILPTILYVLENIVFWLVSLPLLPSLSGALCCSVHKYGNKKKNRRIVLAIMGAMYGSSMLFSILGISGFLDLLASVFKKEGLMLIWILVIAGIEALCIWYELRTLKKKLNLR